MRRPRGFALAVAISVLAVVFMLGLAYSTRSTFHLRNTTRTVTSIQSEYLSDAGMRYAMSQVQAQLAWRQQLFNQGNGRGPQWQWQPFSATFPFDTGTTTVTGVPNGQDFAITSTGTTSKVKHIETATIDWNGGVVQWQDTIL